MYATFERGDAALCSSEAADAVPQSVVMAVPSDCTSLGGTSGTAAGPEAAPAVSFAAAGPPNSPHADTTSERGEVPGCCTPTAPANSDCWQYDNAAHEPGLPTEKHTEKRCSQCSATKTPMWRNDSNGNKTLCNACGVRLQRQVNKLRQQAAATADPPISLIAGKLPRSRTSPAKLSRADLARSRSQDSFANFVPLHAPAGGSRTVTLVHAGSDGEPVVTIASSPPKRKQGEGGAAAAPAADGPGGDAEAKRLCERGKRALQPGAAGLGALPVELLVQQSSGLRRYQNCTASLDSAGGQLLLEVALGNGMKAATCSAPGPLSEPRFDAALRSWVWDSPAGWSLAFGSDERCSDFRGLLAFWIGHQQGAPPFKYPDSPPACHSARMESRMPAIFEPNFSPSYKATDGDLACLTDINAKIREHASNERAVAAATVPGQAAPFQELETRDFERLMHAFDFFSTGLKDQRVKPAHVDFVSRRAPWAPRRAIALLVYNHWLRTRSQPDGPESCAVRVSPPGIASPRPLSRSFSVTSSAGGTMAGGTQATFQPAGLSEPPPTVAQPGDVSMLPQPCAASETSDETQYLDVLGNEAAALTESLALASTAAQLPLSASQGGPGFHTLHSVFAGPSGLPPPWAGEQLPAPASQHAEDEWEPLDPQTLARIADPHLPGPSPGEEHSDQTTDLMETQRSVTPRGIEDQAGVMTSRPDGVHSDGTQPQLAGASQAAAHLRRAVSFADAPGVLRAGSPATPTSRAAKRLPNLTKHYSLKEPGFKKPQHSSFHPEPRTGLFSDMAAVEHENGLLWDAYLGFGS